MATILVLLGIFVVVTVSVGFYFRKKNQSVNAFVLGGRSIGPWLTAFAYGTSYFSAVVFVGYAGQFGWRFGISSVWIGLGNTLIGSLLAWSVLARRTRVMTHHLGSTTMADFFGIRYDAPRLKTAASVITFVFLIPYTASLFNGLSRLFAMAFSVDFTVCILAMALLSGVYVIVGGYIATAVNDFIQGIIMLGGIAAIITAVLKVHGGFLGSLFALAEVTVPDSPVPVAPGVFASFFGPDPLSLLGVVILTSLGTWGLPQMVQKFYAIKSEKNITTGMVVSTIFALIVAGGCYFLGGFSRIFSDRFDIANGFDSIIPGMISHFSPFLIGIVIVLVFSASLSTLSALVMTSATTFVLDFMGSIGKKIEEKSRILWIRIFISFFIIVSSALAIFQYKSSVTFIAQLMAISWGTLAGCFLAPFLYGLYWKRTTKTAIWVNFAFALTVMVSNIFIPSVFPAILRSPLNCGSAVMLAGLIVVPVVSLFGKPDPALVTKCFSCYDEPDGGVSAVNRDNSIVAGTD